MINYKDYTTILECALLYKNELLNSNLLFLYQNRLTGEYNGSKMHINAYRMCGTTAATLAFVKNEKCEYYPSSTLCEDIRNLVKQYNTILAIFQKQLNDSKYKIIQYSNKKFNDQDIPISIRNLIEFENN